MGSSYREWILQLSRVPHVRTVVCVYMWEDEVGMNWSGMDMVRKDQNKCGMDSQEAGDYSPRGKLRTEKRHAPREGWCVLNIFHE
jgi:hypothetical protein